MKKAMLIGLIVAVGLFALGCDSGGGGGGGGGSGGAAYHGTQWTSGSMTLDITDSGWTMTDSSNGSAFRGTFSVSGSTITFAIAAFRENPSSSWMTIAEMEQLSGKPIPANERTMTATVSSDGNTLTTSENEVFTKQGTGGSGGGGGGGGQYEGTVWSNATSVLTFASETEWLWMESDGYATKGTYTVSGSQVFLTATHYSENSGAGWSPAPANFEPYVATVSNGTMSVILDEKDTIVLTKQGLGGGGGGGQ